MQNVKLRKSVHCSLFTVHCLRGFTLIELIIVMFIIAIASGLVGILIHRGSSDLELKTFTKEVSATLRYARSHAIAEKKVYSFIMLEDKRAYGLYVDSPDSEEVEEPVPIIYKNIPEFLETIFENKEDNFRIDFFPQGNSSGGVIEIKNQKGKTFFIIVNRVTGRVKVKKAQ